MANTTVASTSSQQTDDRHLENGSSSPSTSSADGTPPHLFQQIAPIVVRDIRLRYRDAAKFLIWPECPLTKSDTDFSGKGYLTVNPDLTLRNATTHQPYGNFQNVKVKLNAQTTAGNGHTIPTGKDPKLHNKVTTKTLSPQTPQNNDIIQQQSSLNHSTNEADSFLYRSHSSDHHSESDDEVEITRL